MSKGRSPARNSSKVAFQAAACTAAVLVSTPSMSNRHTRTCSGSPSNSVTPLRSVRPLCSDRQRRGQTRLCAAETADEQLQPELELGFRLESQAIGREGGQAGVDGRIQRAQP